MNFRYAQADTCIIAALPGGAACDSGADFSRDMGRQFKRVVVYRIGAEIMPRRRRSDSMKTLALSLPRAGRYPMR